jgi:hypothetical protein
MCPSTVIVEGLKTLDAVGVLLKTLYVEEV